MTKDLFIRRAYTHKGITIVVDIDLIQNQVTLMEKDHEGFKPKKWLFAARGVEYMKGWLSILEAMKYAVMEAEKILEAKAEEDTEMLAGLLQALDMKSLDYKANNTGEDT